MSSQTKTTFNTKTINVESMVSKVYPYLNRDNDDVPTAMGAQLVFNNQVFKKLAEELQFFFTYQKLPLKIKWSNSPHRELNPYGTFGHFEISLYS